MTVESEVAALTTATTNLTNAVGVQQISVNNAVSDFATVIDKVNNELNLVNNTSDVDKPVSTAAQEESNTKQATLVSGDNISTINGLSILDGTPLVIARGPVEVPTLPYEGRGELRTPVAPIPLAGDVVNIPTLGLFQFRSDLRFLDDDDMVFQAVSPVDGMTPIGQWYMTLPAYEWVESQKMFENAVLWEWMEDEPLRFSTYSN